jgi:hypothetical protein
MLRRGVNPSPAPADSRGDIAMEFGRAHGATAVLAIDGRAKPQ